MSLIAVYRQGTSHVGDKGVIMMRTSEDGVTWSAASLVYSHGVHDARDPSITKLADGSLIVSFFIYDHVGVAALFQAVMVTISADDGATWSAAASIGDSFTDSSKCCGPILQLDDRTLLLPFYGSDAGDTRRSIRLMTSADGGATWGGSVTIADGQADGRDYAEPNLVLLSDGSILCMIRMDTGTDTIYKAISTDDGATWGATEACFEGTGAPHTIQLASGVLVICYRSSVNDRAVLRTLLNTGAIWSGEFIFDNTAYGNMAYASPMEISGKVAIAYSLEEYGYADVLYKSFEEEVLVGVRSCEETGKTSRPWMPRCNKLVEDSSD